MELDLAINVIGMNRGVVCIVAALSLVIVD